MRHTAFLHSLSPMASEAPCSSIVFCRSPWVICSLLETTCQHRGHTSEKKNRNRIKKKKKMQDEAEYFHQIAKKTETSFYRIRCQEKSISYNIIIYYYIYYYIHYNNIIIYIFLIIDTVVYRSRPHLHNNSTVSTVIDSFMCQRGHLLIQLFN